jgi:prepilin peptidase CpaA
MVSFEAADLLVPATLACTLATACWHDFRHRRIPNALVAAGLGVAFLFHALAPTGLGMEQALYGAAVGFAALFPLYLLRVMGAGDVKLLAMTGAFFGPHEAFSVVLLTLAAGGVLAVAWAVKSRALAQMAHSVRLVFHIYIAKMAGVTGIAFDPRHQSAARMPYSFAIALGTAVFLILKQGFA